MKVWPPEEIMCPFCSSIHPTKEAEFDYEDTFYVYADCPTGGEVRLKYEFQDRFKRLKEVAIVA